MEQPSYTVVLITTASLKEAQQISQLLLERKQAACVNILPGVDSRFWWKGRIDSAKETLLIVKTRTSLLPEIIDLVRKAHSYTVPEIIALPVIGGNPDYLEWIDDSLE